MQPFGPRSDSPSLPPGPLRREAELPRPRPHAAHVLLVMAFSLFSALAASAVVVNLRAMEASAARTRALHQNMPRVLPASRSQTSMSAVPRYVLEHELELLAGELGSGNCTKAEARVRRLEIRFPDAKLFFRGCDD